MYHRWLRSFHAVARSGGFTAASRVLGIGQPTITDQVKSLESQFGVELFHRRGRTVALTETGRGLLELTHDIFGHEEEAIAFLAGARDLKHGRLKLGGVGAPVAMELVQAFQARHPAIRPEVFIADGTETMRRLRDFEADAAVLAHIESDPAIFYLPYCRSDVVVFVNTDHPWAGRKTIRIRDLEGQTAVLREKTSATRQALERALAAAGVQFGAAMEINSREAVMEGIIRGLGIGAVSELEFVPHERVRAIRIADADVYISFYIACLASRRDRPLIKALLDIAAAKAAHPRRKATE